MPIDKEKKLINRMMRIGKYQTVLLRTDLPMSLEDSFLSALERGKHLEWIVNKIDRLTRDFTIHRGHEGSKRYFIIYYKFITNMIIGFSEIFKESLEREL